MNKPTKTIFAGTSDFAVPFLKSLINDPDFEIIKVLTQPDKPVGRKQILTPSPVKKEVIKNNLVIIQPDSLKNDEDILNIQADLMIVVAYGQIIPQSVLNRFKFGVINVHPSLLPKYRGASPIQNAILNGDKKTGVTVMIMDAKMDHGPILAQKIIKLKGNETNQSLHNDIAKNYPDFLLKTIKKYINGKIKPIPQDDAQATYCQPINKKDAKINWTKSAKVVCQKIRAFNSWPIAWTTLNGKRLKIFSAEALDQAGGQPGQVSTNGNLLVACGSGILKINELQIEGKQKMTSKQFLAGHQNMAGQILE